MKYCVHFIFKNEKVLLLRRKDTNPFYPGIWTPIIGKLKADEDPLKAVTRETFEETQLKIEQPNFLKHCEFDKDDYWFFYSTTYDSKIVLNHENDRHEYFFKNKLPENLWSFFKNTFFEI